MCIYHNYYIYHYKSTELVSLYTLDIGLGENLMLDGETYGCVKSFCYLGDTHDGDGGVDLAATCRIIIGWIRFRDVSISKMQSSPAGDERSSVCPF